MRIIIFLSLCLLAVGGSTTDAKIDIDEACQGYAASNVVESSCGITADLDLIGQGCGIYGPDVPKLTLEVEYQTNSRLHVLIRDRKSQRYRVPEDILPRTSPSGDASSSASDLAFNIIHKPFQFTVTRKSTGEILFNTDDTALVFEKQYLRMKTWLPDDPNIYGLGEHMDSFRLPNKDYTRTLWTRDSAGVPYGQNLYGSHPVYMEHRLKGTHGVFLLNSNGMDIKLDQADHGEYFLEYNVIGGVLDFYFLAGPGPADVARQYAEVVGTPAMVPYWSLGFHQCKYGYRDWFEVAEVAYNYSQADIPLETMWTDIDYMDHRRIFTFDKDNFPVERMQDLVSFLHKRKQRYIVMIDPAVAEHDYHAYNRGVEMDVFMKKNESSYFRGVVWPGVTVFPDWYHPGATEYWVERFKESFDAKSGVDIDGIWIDMNEPASFCHFPCDDPDEQAQDQKLPPDPPTARDPPRKIPGLPPRKYKTGEDTIEIADVSDKSDAQEPLEELKKREERAIYIEADHDGDNLLSPPYNIDNHSPTGELSDLTMHTNLRHANGLWTYDTHNIYGMLMSMATRTAMLKRRSGLRPFIVTRSSFAGSGRYVSKWLGDNASKWDHYRSQIAQMLAFASIFQMPMVGSDVCGFLGEATEKLCARWATLGAFNPFFRNHADAPSPSQEFYRWPLVASAARYAIDVRYQLLDYLYSALEGQSQDGTPTLKPMWHVYPSDPNTFALDMQFFYGDCILVAPVTEDEGEDVKVYLPDDLFYEWETRDPIRGTGEWVTLRDIPFDRIPLFIRGGCIVPLRRQSANTTTALRKQRFRLLVATGLDGTAEGSLYTDDGVSLDGGPERRRVALHYGGGSTTVWVEEGAVGDLEEVMGDMEDMEVLRETADDDQELWPWG